MSDSTAKTDSRSRAGWHLFRRFGINLGRLMLDAAKLTFGSLVLGAVIRGSIEQSMLLQAGIIASTGAAVVGLVLTTFIKE
jgi:hypothetical protein